MQKLWPVRFQKIIYILHFKLFADNNFLNYVDIVIEHSFQIQAKQKFSFLKHFSLVIGTYNWPLKFETKTFCETKQASHFIRPLHRSISFPKVWQVYIFVDDQRLL